MGALPRPDLPAGAHRDLVDALHELHHRAGWPSLRRIAAATEFSHTTVSAVLSSSRLPAWDVLAAVVAALDGDADDFHGRWLAATTPEDDAASAPPLAGRRDELGAVARFVERADGLLLVLGEAGMGKTTLVEAGAAGADRTALTARCLPLARGEPMMPVSALLRAALRCDDGAWFREALAECAPFVRESVSLILPELGPGTRRPGATSDWAQQQLFAAVSMTLSALARARACAVVLDDVQWADSTTLGFVEHHLAHGDGPPILAAWRLGDTTAAVSREWRTRVTRLPSVATLHLGPLTRAETAAQLTALGVTDAAAVDRIHARSEGLPLFTEHLARHGGPTEGLPRGLAELLALRLDGVSETARRIEQTLAVMNRPTEADVLPLLTGLESDQVSAGLHELDSGHLLRSSDGSVMLSHPLLGEAVRHRMFALELTQEHHRVATALEVLHHAPRASAPPVAAAEIAEHWQGAGEPEAELAWRVRAAQAAQAEWGLAEAAGHWRRALDLWPADMTELAAPSIPRSSAQLAALNALLEVDRERGHELARRAVVEIGDRSDVEAAAILRMAGTLANLNGDRDAARDLLERAIEILRGEPPSTDLFDALFALTFVHLASGSDHEAAAVVREAAELARRIGATDRYRLAQTLLAGYAVTTGDRAAVTRCLAESAPDAASDPEPGIAVRTAMNRVGVLIRVAAPADSALAAAEPGFAAARAWGSEYVPLAILRESVAEALRMAGRVAEAAEYIDRQPGAEFERAMLDMLRGQSRAALARARTVARGPFRGLDHEVECVEKLALVALWAGKPAGLLDQTLDVLDRAVTTEAVTYAAPLLVVAARAAVESHRGAPADTDAQRADRRLRAIVERAVADPFAALATVPTRSAHAAQWAGELARLHGRADPAPWATAARRWDRLLRPHDAAYCRWRAAEAAAASGQATQAARLARRALTDARTHTPLRQALTAFLQGPGIPAGAGLELRR